MSEYLLVNFGGPRDLSEIPSFLKALLCDRDVIRTRFPTFFHNYLFSRIAKKRAKKVAEDYAFIGGRSPIFFDTEKMKEELEKKLGKNVYTFHRYLPATHEKSILEIRDKKHLTVLPLFPQFCYATTGSVARFLHARMRSSLSWIKSYPTHPAFISSFQRKIKEFLKEKNISEENALLLFSAHGVPKKFIDEGDPYEKECNLSFEAIKAAFPKALSKLCYQSKFGRGEWLKPSTEEAAENVLAWNGGRKQVVFIPLSFTSDHIETLFEIEKLYLPIVEKKGLLAYRCPALNLEPYWIDALVEILKETTTFETQKLIR